jgi:hypothetical protein
MSKFLSLLGDNQEPVAPASESTTVGYNENATDRDGDGLVQDGTPFERPALTTTSKKKKGFTMD